jgi:hypothetical protein
MSHYINMQHRKNEVALSLKLKDKINYGEYESAVYLLTIPTIFGVADKHVDYDGIDFEEILKYPFSSSERFLVEVAKVLFKSSNPDKMDLSSVLYLNEDNLKAFYRAISIRMNFNIEFSERG